MNIVRQERKNIADIADEYLHNNREEARLAIKEYNANCSWGSALEASVYGEYEVIPLTDGRMLADEAAAMHHCVDGYVNLCKEKGHRIFSIREKGERIATLQICKYPHGKSVAKWEVRQVRRHCNGMAPPLVKALADRVANDYQAACAA
jgi:hypothetical protein